MSPQLPHAASEASLLANVNVMLDRVGALLSRQAADSASLRLMQGNMGALIVRVSTIETRLERVERSDLSQADAIGDHVVEFRAIIEQHKADQSAAEDRQRATEARFVDLSAELARLAKATGESADRVVAARTQIIVSVVGAASLVAAALIAKM